MSTPAQIVLPLPAVRVPFGQREMLLTSGAAWINVDGVMIEGQPSDGEFADILAEGFAHDRATQRAGAQANAAARAWSAALNSCALDAARAKYVELHVLTKVMAAAAMSRRNLEPHADAHNESMRTYFARDLLTNLSE